MLPRTVRLVAPAIALALTAVAGCATGDAPTKDSASAPASPAAQGACDTPPAAPGNAKQYDQVPSAATARGKTFTATIRTTCGDIVLELDGVKAPQTVASFINLARTDYWKNSPCHRLTAGDSLSVLQCGDPTGSGSGDPGYGYGIENAPADGQYPTDAVAMARTQDPNSNGGQFFLVYADSQIDPSTGGYSIFGKIVDGKDVLSAVTNAGAKDGAPDGPPAQPVSILSVTVTEKKA